MNDRLLQALNGQNTGRPPVWLMRQAGRYLPEYRAVRQKYSFLQMVKIPEVAAEVTRQPIDIFGMDAAIVFADILLLVEALGCGLRFEEKIGPIIDRPVRNAKDIRSLPDVNVEETTGYLAETIRILCSDLDVPVIGFAGAPFTVASYMVEGRSSRDLKRTRQWAYNDPKSFGELLSKLVDVTISYLRMQVAAGARALQLFDSWANYLSHEQFRLWSLEPMQRILEGVADLQVPVILFCRGSSVFAEQLAELQPAGIGLDWNCDLPTMRKRIPRNICLQGNFDPFLLYAEPKRIESEVRNILEQMADEPAYIVNLGHGISPDMPVENVRTFVDTVKEWEVASLAHSS